MTASTGMAVVSEANNAGRWHATATTSRCPFQGNGEGIPKIMAALTSRLRLQGRSRSLQAAVRVLQYGD